MKSLLTHFLPLPDNSTIIDLETLNPELTSGKQSSVPRDSGKTFILDIVARYERKDSKGQTQEETVNVEIQTTAQDYFTDRILAYSGRLYSEQLRRGEKRYNRLNPVYSLVFRI